MYYVRVEKISTKANEYWEGVDYLTNSNMLRMLIAESGKTYTHLADCIGISRFSLAKKIDNRTEFKTGEAKILCEELGIKSLSLKEKIFFANGVEENSTKGGNHVLHN